MDATKTKIIDLFYEAIIKDETANIDVVSIKLTEILKEFENKVKNNCDKSNVKSTSICEHNYKPEVCGGGIVITSCSKCGDVP